MPDLSPELLRRLRDGAAERDRDRQLPRAEVRELLDAGFGSARVPVEHGGEGVDLATLFARIIDLAAADSNVAHVFRGHLAVIEMQNFEPDAARREAWYARALAGDLVGNAQSEQTATSDLATTLTSVDGELRLNGRKYYTTGSIYADWIDLSARYRDEDYQVIVSTRTPGVESIDDWAGFGQRLTGSGTTTFTDVVVDPELVRPYALDLDGFRHPYLMGFFQLVLLAVVAGVGRAAVDDAVAFVQPRRRIFGYGGEAFPREDPLVQTVVGTLSSAAFAARATVLEAGRSLDAALAGYRAGEPDADAFTQAQFDVYRAQQTVLPTVIDATAELFEVGGASSVDTGRGLDRHWRNARTIATHNPSVQRRRAIGDWELNAAIPLFNQPQASMSSTKESAK
ncbi:acyl-CoA dehydrogenase family protein [Microbacterium sp. SA39]|uniref:acyl-CoA dehydrogenase family protein n=1 Tax=Microbacterium sp. SA39 TaxID=1263625 RepID=UPI0005FA688E|nr:acyl-CoA dehydrogenase family protein [Microbacterium sp. SA39]KJQ55435.1 Dibenzothiophene desulfurization enzyme C [Microbacterium sp. SA39]